MASAFNAADVADNMDLRRIPQPTDKDHARLQESWQGRALLEASRAGDFLPINRPLV